MKVYFASILLNVFAMLLLTLLRLHGDRKEKKNICLIAANTIRLIAKFPLCKLSSKHLIMR